MNPIRTRRKPMQRTITIQPYCTRTIRTTDVGKLRHGSRLQKETILFGGPPCQGFSYSNSRTRSRRNPDNWLFLHFLRILGNLQPDWVVFENVRGVVDTAGGLFLAEVLSRIDELGYTIRYDVLNAQTFGVPQDRGRLFVIGSRDHARIQMPSEIGTPCTVRDAIADLPELVNGASVSWMPYKDSGGSEYSRFLRRMTEAFLKPSSQQEFRYYSRALQIRSTRWQLARHS